MLSIDNRAKPPEIKCAKILVDFILPQDDWIVGDNEKDHLPDLYNRSRTHGIEVVQMEVDSDLDRKYVWNAMINSHNDFQKVKLYCDQYFPGQYHIAEYNGKVRSISSTEGAHYVDWMKEIYIRLLQKKLEKLNRGNYGGINGQIDLCISIDSRAKDQYDALLVTYCYWQLKEQYRDVFKKLFVIENEDVFVIDPTKFRNMVAIGDECIHNFQIEGDDDIKQFKWN